MFELRIRRCQWSEDAASALVASTKWFPLATVDDYRLLVERDSDAGLYRLEDAQGAIHGYGIFKIERFAKGAEGVIIAVAARVPGVDLTERMLTALEGVFDGVVSYRVTTARPGLIRKLTARGYVQTHAVLRKAVAI